MSDTNTRPTRLEDTGQRDNRIASWFGLGLLLAFILGASLWSARSWSVLAPSAQVLAGGIIALCAILAAALLIVMRTGGAHDRRAERRDTLYTAAFFEADRPQLITRDNVPVLANRAYLDMARTLKIDMVGDTPPPVDRLFAPEDGEASSALFRLYHMPDAERSAETVVALLSPDGESTRYRVRVDRLGTDASARLWTVEPSQETGPDRSVLSQAPIGLFSVSRDGHILSLNETLERWLGGPDAVAPDHMGDFIENPEVLLESDAVHGKTVRAGTRLVTRKGVVTPTVMV
ncbi:MAG: PAS domain-containing protein, partial [Litorimonas sp.]